MISQLLSAVPPTIYRLVLVRHGQDTGSLNGGSHRALSDLGKKQAQRTGQFLSDINFDTFHSSDLLRTNETASVVSSEINQEFTLTEQLREIRPFYAMGEVDLAEVQARPIKEFLSGFKEKPPGSLHLVVSHCHLIRYLFSLYSLTETERTVSVPDLFERGLVNRGGCTIDVGNCSISILDLSTGGFFEARQINFTDHWKGQLQDS